MMGESIFNCCYVPPHPPGEEEHLRSRRSEIMASQSAYLPSDKRFLIFFDFDETIVDETSDDLVVQAAPGQHLPDWLKDTYQPGRYNEYMQRVLGYLAEQGVTESHIRSVMEKIPATPGMLMLFQFLRTRPPPDFEVVLVSDSNMFFIESWLRRAGARQLFHRIFTNPATFNKDGRLMLRPFHSHDCPRCPVNMCKQVVVRDYVARRTQERGRPFQRVFYVGDGANDFCPALSLGSRDVVFPRRDFPMHRLITETHEAMPGEFKAITVPWVSAEDVVQRLRKLVTE
ncbi:putative phosphatase phospho1 [Neosynchiropus ocellatus]